MDIDRLIEEAYADGAVQSLVDKQAELVSSLEEQIKPLAFEHAKNRATGIFATDDGKDFYSGPDCEQLEKATENSSRDLTAKIAELKREKAKLEALKPFPERFHSSVRRTP